MRRQTTRTGDVRVICVGLLLLGLFSISPYVTNAAEVHRSNEPATVPPDFAILFKAMEQEVTRTMSTLKIPPFPAPYFMDVSLRDEEVVRIEARNGGLFESRGPEHRRNGFVELRVGDYTFDQTQFSQQYGWWGQSRPRAFDSFIDYRNLPLRKEIWLAADEEFKEALEIYQGKKTFLSTHHVDRRPPDFTREKALVFMSSHPLENVSKEQMEQRVAALSRLFNAFPRIMFSSVTLVFQQGHTLYFNSEGSKVLRPLRAAVLRVLARSQAPDGTALSTFLDIPDKNVRAIVQRTDLEDAITHIAGELEELMDAPDGVDDYAPILFQGQAAAQLFGQLLAEFLGSPRNPLIDEDSFTSSRFSSGRNPLVTMMNRKLMPETMSVIDDPLRLQFNNQPLLGSFKVDDQAVPARRVTIVHKGFLRHFLHSRIPTRFSHQSNGHAFRNAAGVCRGAISNLIIRGTKGVSEKKLMKRFIKLCRKQGCASGYIVKKIAPAWLPEDEAEGRSSYHGRMGFNSGTYALSDPILIYRYNVETGEQTLVKNLSFGSPGPGILRDIMAYSKQFRVYPYYLQTAGNSGENAVIRSIVCPDILLESMELRIKSRQKKERPLLKSPLQSK